MSIQKIEHSGKRIETGPIQFGDDLPGVFIRGDNALWFAHNVEMAALLTNDACLASTLERLAGILSSCDAYREESC